MSRVPEVMAVVRGCRETAGRNVMVAFNIMDETDVMHGHADLVVKEGGSCVVSAASRRWSWRGRVDCTDCD